MASVKITKWGAPWCAPCKVMKKNNVLKNLKKDNPSWIIKDINIDNHEKQAMKNNVTGLPCIDIQVGNQKQRFVGGATKRDLEKLVDMVKHGEKIN